MRHVMNRNGQRVYCPLWAAADFSQKRVKREWFVDHGICSYHRISQHLVLGANPRSPGRAP
jgi:hypothetical protein